jgi:hypothetical protein
MIMGDRVSISFSDGREVSVVLFSHWGGMGFVKQAQDYIKELNEYIRTKPKGISFPLDRKEPSTVMVDFIRHITKNEERIESDLYLGAIPEDGDNSDNGHFIIDV